MYLAAQHWFLLFTWQSDSSRFQPWRSHWKGVLRIFEFDGLRYLIFKIIQFQFIIIIIIITYIFKYFSRTISTDLEWAGVGKSIFVQCHKIQSTFSSIQPCFFLQDGKKIPRCNLERILWNSMNQAIFLHDIVKNCCLFYDIVLEITGKNLNRNVIFAVWRLQDPGLCRRPE